MSDPMRQSPDRRNPSEQPPSDALSVGGPVGTLTASTAQTASAFVSYSQHRQTALRLTEELRLRGFATFRDLESIEHGHRIEADIASGLARADVVVFDLTEEALASTPVVDLEFKPSRQLAEENACRPVRLCVCRGLGADASAVQDRTWSILAEPFDATWTKVIPEPTDTQIPIALAHAKAVANLALRGAFGVRLDPIGRAWKVKVSTHGTASPGGDFNVDATSLVGGDARQPGQPEQWQRIWDGLVDLERAMTKHSSITDVELTLSSHLTAGLAAGFAFRRTKGWSLQVGARGSQALCAQSDHCTQDDLDFKPDPGSLNSTYMTVEIDLLGNGIGLAVGEALRAMTPPRQRLSWSLKDNSTRIDPDLFGAMAASIGRNIKREQARLRTTDVHLFVAAPVQFAALLGAELNALNATVHLYEHHEHSYRPSLTLDAR